MSDGIFYRKRLLGSVHYFIYQKGKLPGHNGDVYLRFDNHESLETLLQLPPSAVLRIGDEKVTSETFRKETLGKARDIHFDYNDQNRPAYPP